MQVTYVGKSRAVSVDNGSGGEVRVANGETVDLPDEIAQRLIEQGWKRAAAPTKKAAPESDEPTPEETN